MKKALRLSGMWERFNHTVYPFHANRFTQSNHSLSLPQHHFHDFPQVWYLVKGKYTHKIGDNVYTGLPGSLMIVPSGVPHDYTFEAGTECDFIMLSAMPSFFDVSGNPACLAALTNLLLANFSDKLNFTPVYMTMFEGEDRRRTEELFFRLTSCNWLRNMNNYESLRAEVFDFFSTGVFELSQNTLKKAKNFYEKKYLPLIKTVYFMNINYNKIIHRDELISMSNICQTDYFRLIKKVIGCTYSTYMQLIRVRRAIQMFTFSTYSLSYIADICGFGDLSYMEKRVKKFNPDQISPCETKKLRNRNIKVWPFAIKSRSEYENISKNFYAYGL